MNARIRKRARSRRFAEFRRKRLKQLVASGVGMDVARRFARLETEGRARVSFSTSIDEALAAQLDFVGGMRAERPRFQLIYPPQP